MATRRHPNPLDDHEIRQRANLLLRTIDRDCVRRPPPKDDSIDQVIADLCQSPDDIELDAIDPPRELLYHVSASWFAYLVPVYARACIASYSGQSTGACLEYSVRWHLQQEDDRLIRIKPSQQRWLARFSCWLLETRLNRYAIMLDSDLLEYIESRWLDKLDHAEAQRFRERWIT